MSAELAPNRFFTEADYYREEEASQSRHEYFRGEIYLMAGASPAHVVISMNLGRELSTGLKGKSCEARGNDQKLKISATGLITYPDLSVVCPPLKYDSIHGGTLVDATVIVEILSPSTRKYDIGVKFEHYQQLPSLRHYLLVEQERVSVEHRQLNIASHTWGSMIHDDLDDTIHLSAIDCVLSLRDLYDRVVF